MARPKVFGKRLAKWFWDFTQGYVGSLGVTHLLFGLVRL